MRETEEQRRLRRLKARAQALATDCERRAELAADDRHNELMQRHHHINALQHLAEKLRGLAEED